MPAVAAHREFPDGKVARWQLPERWTFPPRGAQGKFGKKALRDRYTDGGLDVTTLS